MLFLLIFGDILANSSISGTIIIALIITAGIALILFSGISVLSNPEYLNEPQPLVVPTPVSATSTSTTSPTIIPSATPTPTTQPARTPTPTEIPATAASTKARAADDSVLGTWTGTKTLNLLFITADGEGTVTFRDDLTSHVSGGFRGAGMDKTFSSGFTWTNNGGGSYTGNIGSESLIFSPAGETLTMTINPKQLGVASLDMNIPVEMHR